VPKEVGQSINFACNQKLDKGQNCPNGPITFPAVFGISKARCICVTLIVPYTVLVALSNDAICILIGAKMSELHRQKYNIAKHWDSFVPHCSSAFYRHCRQEFRRSNHIVRFYGYNQK
jgi:hypothetical protein